MFELRKIREIVKEYEIVLVEYPEIIKEDVETYLNDIIMIKDFVNVYVEENHKIYEAAGDFCEDVSKMSDKNFLLKLHKKVEMKVAYYYVSKYDSKIKNAYNLQERIDKIERRLIQFKKFS